MTAADLATTADIARIEAAIAGLAAKIDAVACNLPSTWVSLTDAAHRLGRDPRTVAAMIARGEVIGRRAGRRWLVDLASLRPPDAAEISRMAAEARK